MSARAAWASLGAFALLGFAACNQTVGECYPRGQGQGSEGAGAGVLTSAGVGAAGAGEGPPAEPQNVTYSEAECNAPDEQGTYIRCRGEGPTACAARCNAIGAYCVEFGAHPNNPALGIGKLKQCMEGLMTYTCTYCFDNGDACTYICALRGCGLGDCTNTGGKGCE